MVSGRTPSTARTSSRATAPTRWRRGARPDAHPVAEPHPGRQLRVPGTSASAAVDRDGALECDPRPRPLGRVGGTRARAGPRRARIRPPCAARVSVHARAPDRVPADRGRSHRADDCDEHRQSALSIRKRCAPVPHAGSGRRSTTAAPGAARTALSSDDRGIPTGTVAVDGTELDFRSHVASARRSSTTATPISSATIRVAPTSRSRGSTDRLGRYGSTRAMRTSWSSPATYPTCNAEVSRSSP